MGIINRGNARWREMATIRRTERKETDQKRHENRKTDCKQSIGRPKENIGD